ncbi:MAG: glycoside hydrolase family 5 protein, partial [Planctomycetota bacterium]
MPASLASSHFRRLVLLLTGVATLTTGCAAEAGPPEPEEVVAAADTALAVAANKRFARTINLSNALEAPKEGEWGYTIEELHLDAIKAAGFTAVRIPVKWTAHAQKTAPFAVDPEFFARIDEVLDQALERRLAVVLDLHHYDEIHEDPSDAHFDRLAGIWRQIARRYQNRPAALAFEPLNEPSLQLTTERWSEKFPEVLAVIRETNPTRAVLVGPGNWNQIQELKDLTLPPDPNLILTVHTYEPYEFTHQGATWNENPPPTGRPFPRTGEEEEIRQFLDVCREYAESRNRPVFVGEFGVIRHANPADRARWAEFMRTEYEKRGWS